MAVQSPHHVALECPLTAPVRKAVADAAHAASLTDPLLKSLLHGHDEQSIALASLGAPLAGPWKKLGTGPYSTLVGLAGPLWAKGLASHL